MNNIIFNKTESFGGRNISGHACQIYFSKGNCESVYHWFFLLEITVSKLLNYLNVCSSHSYLYPRSRFKNISMYLITLFIFRCHNVNWDEHRLQQFKPSGQKTKIENWKHDTFGFISVFLLEMVLLPYLIFMLVLLLFFLYSDCHFWMI